MPELISNVSYRTRHPRSRLNRSAVINLKSTFWITFWVSWIVFAPFYWIAFTKDGGILLVGFNLFFQALMVVLAVVFEPFPRRINSALVEFVEANNGRFTILKQLPTDSFHEEIVHRSHIWSLVQSLGQKKPDEHDKANKASQPGIGVSGLTDLGDQFYLGRLVRSGPYADFSFFVLELDKLMPHILIDADASAGRLSENSFRFRLNPDDKFDLEGPFADRFSLYAPGLVASAIATEILTPDLMERILKLGILFDIEIIEDKLFVVWKSDIGHGNWIDILRDGISMANSLGLILREKIMKYNQPEELKNEQLYLKDVPETTFNTVTKTIGKIGWRYIRVAPYYVFRRNKFWFVMVVLLFFIVFVTLSWLIIYYTMQYFSL